MQTYTPELFAALKETILEKLRERVAIALTEYTDGLEESLEHIIVAELRKFWKDSEEQATHDATT